MIYGLLCVLSGLKSVELCRSSMKPLKTCKRTFFDNMLLKGTTGPVDWCVRAYLNVLALGV